MVKYYWLILNAIDVWALHALTVNYTHTWHLRCAHEAYNNLNIILYTIKWYYSIRAGHDITDLQLRNNF